MSEAEIPQFDHFGLKLQAEGETKPIEYRCLHTRQMSICCPMGEGTNTLGGRGDFSSDIEVPRLISLSVSVFANGKGKITSKEAKEKEYAQSSKEN